MTLPTSRSKRVTKPKQKVAAPVAPTPVVVAAPQKISICPTHGNKHALSSGLCTYPTCVEKVIGHQAKRHKGIALFWKRIKQYSLKDDFIIWAIKELLREEQKHGKKPTLNHSWLYLRLKNYLWHEAHKSSNPYWRVPDTAKTKLQKASIYYEDLKEKYKNQGQEHIFDAVINKGLEFSNEHNNQPTPIEELEYNELKNFIISNFGEPWLLYASGDINLIDLSKLTNLKQKEAKDLWENKVKISIKKDYLNGWKKELKRAEDIVNKRDRKYYMPGEEEGDRDE